MGCEQVNAGSDNILIILYVIFVSLVGSQSRKTFHSCPLYLSLQKGLWGWKVSSRTSWHCIMRTNPDHKKGVLTSLYIVFAAFLRYWHKAGGVTIGLTKCFLFQKYCRRVERSLLYSVFHLGIGNFLQSIMICRGQIKTLAWFSKTPRKSSKDGRENHLFIRH